MGAVQKTPVKVVYLLFIYPKISETFILNEMLAMQKKGVSIGVFALEPGRDKERHAGVARIPEVMYFVRNAGAGRTLFAHGYWCFRKPLNYLKTWVNIFTNGWRIRKFFIAQLYNTVLIDRMEPDLVHAHFGEDAANMALLYSLVSGRPFTFTTHAHEIFDVPQKNFPFKTRMAKRHITISEFNKRHLVEKMGAPADKISIVHCGTDLDSLPAASKKAQDPPLILTIARLSEEKRLDVLVESLAKLAASGRRFQAALIGDGQERAALEKQIQSLGLSDRIQLLGNRTHQEVFQWLGRSSVMVLSSRSEGIPVSMMEAMAMRVPVVATNIRGIPELVQDGVSGFLVEPGDPQALADRIGRLLDDPALCSRFAQTGFEKVRRDFNLVTETDKLLEIWKS